MQRTGDFQYIAPNMQALIADNHYNHSDDCFAVFCFIGTDGVITGTVGAMYNYPDGRPDTLEWSSRRFYADKRFEAKLEGKWIPDSFIGPTASSMLAIQVFIVRTFCATASHLIGDFHVYTARSSGRSPDCGS